MAEYEEIKFIDAPIKVQVMKEPSDIESVIPNAKTIVIEGTAITSSVNDNGWYVPDGELDNIAKQLAGQPFSTNHGDKIEDASGRVTKAWREGNQVKYIAKYTTTNDKELVAILTNVDNFGVSIELDADSVCDKCEKPFCRGIQLCECKNTKERLCNITDKGLSLVRNPAYGKQTKSQIGFSASFDKKRKEVIELAKKTNEEIKVPEPTPVKEAEVKENPQPPVQTEACAECNPKKTEEEEKKTKKSEEEEEEKCAKISDSDILKIATKVAEIIKASKQEKKAEEEEEEQEAEEEEEEEEKKKKKKASVKAKVDNSTDLTPPKEMAKTNVDFTWNGAWDELKKARENFDKRGYRGE